MIYKSQYCLKFIAVAVVTIAIFIFLFHRISFAKVFNLIKEANLGVIGVVLAISFLKNIFISSNRWRLIIRELGPEIPLKDILFIKLGSDPLVDILPLKVGEFLKIAYLRSNYKIPYSKAISSIVIGYILNLVMIFFYVIIGVIFFLKNKITTSVNLKIVFALPIFEKFKQPGKLYDFIPMKKIIKSKGVLTFTFLFIGAGLVNFYLLSLALGNQLSFVSILMFVPLVVLAGNLHLTISGLGVRESAVLFCFSGAGSPEFLLSLGILYSFTEGLFPVLLGLPFSGVFIKRILADEGKE